MTRADADSAEQTQEQARQWLLRLRAGNASEADAEAFRQWCSDHPQAAHRLRDTWSTLRLAAEELAEEEQSVVGVWTGEAKRRSMLRTSRRAFIGFAAAAGASWLALRPPLQLWPSVSDMAADYRTGTGEQRQVALSTRVSVELNTQTSLDVLPAKAAVRGVELLAGEAEIDARAPALRRVGLVEPVTVVAGRGRMQAQVARFNVRRTGDATCVTCISGTVTFEHQRQRFALQAGEQVTYDDRRVQSVSRVDPAAVIAWRRGVLVFDGVPLSEVVAEINRYRRGRLVLRNAALGKNRMQAQFPITKLDDVIDMLGRLYGAHVTRLPGDIVVLS